MPQDWTYERFAQSINTEFVAQHPQWGSVPLELVSVSELRETTHQRMFSLTFRGPLDFPIGQGGVSLVHADMGTEALFLVPVGREADGFRYEAVFNLLRQGVLPSQG